ncbi:MAG: hypothetical protein H6637_05380 [Ardenticatenales bacterium]|nr:hypothetical protein [Ardenticatenales bacterium]
MLAPLSGALSPLASRTRISAGFVGAYDAIPSIAAAYSTRRLLTGYTGSLLRLRRSSDNAESDFGYTAAGDLDTAAIATWLGGASGYVTTWYDQSGNGRHATQATAASQPLYVASGQNGRPLARFDGTNDMLAYSEINLVSATVFVVGRHSNTAYGIILSHSITNAQLRYATDATTVQVVGAERNLGSPSVTGDTSVAHLVTLRATTSAAQLALNGSYGSATAHSDTTFPTDQIGRRLTTSEPLGGDIAELVICNADLSGGDRAAAETAANDYWAIY